MNTKSGRGHQGTKSELGRPRRAAPPPLPAAATRGQAPAPARMPALAPARVRPSPIVVSRDPLEETIVRPLRLDEMQAQLAQRAAHEARRQHAYELERFAPKAALDAPPPLEPEDDLAPPPVLAPPVTRATRAPLAPPVTPATVAARGGSSTQPSVRRLAMQRGRLSRETFQLVVRKLGEDYRALSTPKRLLIPVAVMILALAAPTSSRAGENTASGAPRTTAAAARPSALAAPVPSSRETRPESAGRLAGTAVTAAAAPVDPHAETKLLPSARALAPAAHAKLTADEQRLYDRAITATLSGEYDAASIAYAKLVAAHPDSAELRAAVRVLAAKQKRKAQR